MIELGEKSKILKSTPSINVDEERDLDEEVKILSEEDLIEEEKRDEFE